MGVIIKDILDCDFAFFHVERFVYAERDFAMTGRGWGTL